MRRQDRQGILPARETGRAFPAASAEDSSVERFHEQTRQAMVKARWAVFGLAGAVALAGTGVIAAAIGPFGSETIAQPILFPHDLHAGTNQIPCEYCHYSVDRSVDAGIPAVQVCAGCHIAGGQALFRRDSTGIKQLVAYWNEQKPIPWVRIHSLPDHAHFPHMRHIKADVQCEECHGDLKTAREVTVQQKLWMGWCIQCHRDKQVRTDCSVCHY